MRRLALVAACAFSTACFGFEGVRGSGRVVSEERQVEPFDGIEVGGGIHLRVETGSPALVEVEADDNLIRLVETRVEDGRMHVRFRRDVWGSDDVRVRVRAKAINYLGGHGGSEVDALLAPQDALTVEGSGGTVIRVRGIEVSDLNAAGSGGSRLELSGTADKMSLQMSGGTRIKARDLAARAVRLDGSGGCKAEVRASEMLRGSLSGGADVRLIGKASSRVKTSGGASVNYDDD